MLFWAITQRVLAISYRRFGKTYRSRLQGSRIEERSCHAPRRGSLKWSMKIRLPVYDAVQCGRNPPRLQRPLLPPSSGQTILWNLSTVLPDHKVPHIGVQPCLLCQPSYKMTQNKALEGVLISNDTKEQTLHPGCFFSITSGHRTFRLPNVLSKSWRSQ